MYEFGLYMPIYVKYRLCLNVFRLVLSEFAVICQNFSSILSSPLGKWASQAKNYIHPALNISASGGPTAGDALTLKAQTSTHALLGDGRSRHDSGTSSRSEAHVLLDDDDHCAFRFS
jgi:hypothetical protein